MQKYDMRILDTLRRLTARPHHARPSAGTPHAMRQWADLPTWHPTAEPQSPRR